LAWRASILDLSSDERVESIGRVVIMSFMGRAG
jgi:hypothetical protein